MQPHTNSKRSLSLQDKTVLITGASSGIGRSCAFRFAEEGCNLILAARRVERLMELKREIGSNYHNIDVVVKPLDVTDKQSVEKFCKSLEHRVDILINNAGLSKGMSKIHEGEIEDWEQMIDTNIKGVLYVTRHLVPPMIKNGYGHIVYIGSTAGRQTYVGGSVYCATKFAIKALNSATKQDLLGTPVRCSSIDPGAVETEFSLVRFNNNADKADAVYEGITPLTAEDIADTICFAVTRPLHVNISEILLMPSDQAPNMMFHRNTK
jgi:3-hydroxy acid dehydrogenase / malonic semialdehyde reductase